MVVINRKQIVVLALVLMVVIAGYLQYSYRRNGESYTNDEGKLGEAVYVDSEDLAGEDLLEDEDIGVSLQAKEFFAQAKIDREITRSRDVDTYREIMENPNSSEELRAEAFENMMAIIEKNELEMRIENLIKERGFGDVVALFASDGSIDIIVKAESLTVSKVAQISDIVTRHADIGMDQVHIKHKY